MRILRSHRRTIALPTVVIFMLWSLPHGTSQAAMISTKQATAAPSRNADEARSHVLRTLRRSDVEAEMRALGIDPAEAAARVKAMSDSEVQEIAGRMDALPAGGNYLLTVTMAAILAVVAISTLLALLIHYLVSSSSDERQSPPPRTH